MVGQTIAQYEILERLGGGGMGVVYKAHDTKLDRAVALKFLPTHLSKDLEANERFIREAKAASALDHPNICTIYDINEDDEEHLFIAMAYYQGQTLKYRLDDGLSVAESVEIAIQVAEGLEQAHEEGIVHRDIKPANVMVTDRGRVKILDFGVAKLGGSAAFTKAGSTLGTVAYMSPEQTHGEEVDNRTDVWALGVVLYEMLTGVRPFRGDYDQAVIYSILNQDPEPISALRPDVPEALVQIVDRMLSKEASARYQTMAEALAALKVLHYPVNPVAPVAQPRWRWIGATAGVVVVLAVAGYFLFKANPEAVVFTLGQSTRMTGVTGLELHPTLSPDGRMLAYVAGPVGQMRLFVRQVAGGRTVPLTDDVPGDHHWPRWSPDGNHIAFQSQQAIWVVEALGGIPRRLVDSLNGASARYLAWSPDGQQIAYTRAGTIYVRAVDDSQPSVLVEDLFDPHSLAWSPEGSRIAYVAGNRNFVFGTTTFGNLAHSSLWVVPVQSGEVVRVTENDHMNMSPVWLPDGQGLLFVSDRDGSRDVHQVTLSVTGEPLGPPTRLTTGLNAHTIHLSTDGTQLAYAVFTERNNMWSIPIPENGSISVIEAHPVTTENQIINGIDVSSDGQWLVFDSNRSGNSDIYKMPITGGEPEQLTSHPADDFLPAWSPDGQEIVFYSFRNGNRDVHVMSAEGRSLQQLTDDPAHEYYPDWSRDGQQVVFRSLKTGRSELYVTSRDGQVWEEPAQLTFDGGAYPRWSPSDDLIAYIEESSLRIISPEEGTPRVLVPRQDPATLPIPRFPAWSSDGLTVYYKAYDAALQSSIWSVSASGGLPRLLVVFDEPARPSHRHEFTTDGERFFFTITERESDIWVMDLLTEE